MQASMLKDLAHMPILVRPCTQDNTYAVVKMSTFNDHTTCAYCATSDHAAESSTLRKSLHKF